MENQVDKKGQPSCISGEIVRKPGRLIFVVFAQRLYLFLIAKLKSFQPNHGEGRTSSIPQPGEQKGWPRVSRMIGESLPAFRALFLEKSDNEHHHQLAFTVGCNPEDLRPAFLDERCLPFSDALASKRPLLMNGLLRRGNRNEVHFLIPLKDNQQVLGFWILAMDKPVTYGETVDIITELAREITSFLVDRQSLAKQGRVLLRRLKARLIHNKCHLRQVPHQ